MTELTIANASTAWARQSRIPCTGRAGHRIHARTHVSWDPGCLEMKQSTLCDYEIVGSGEEGSPHDTFMSRASSARELVVRLRNIHNQPPPPPQLQTHSLPSTDSLLEALISILNKQEPTPSLAGSTWRCKCQVLQMPAPGTANTKVRNLYTFFLLSYSK